MNAETKAGKLPISISPEEKRAFKAAADRIGIPLSTFLKVAGLYCADLIERTGSMPIRPSSTGIRKDIPYEHLIPDKFASAPELKTVRARSRKATA